MVEGGLVLLLRLAEQLVIWAKEMYQGALLGDDLHLLDPNSPSRSMTDTCRLVVGKQASNGSYEFICPGEVGRTTLPGLEGCLCALAMTWQSRGVRLRPRADHEGGRPGSEGAQGSYSALELTAHSTWKLSATGSCSGLEGTLMNGSLVPCSNTRKASEPPARTLLTATATGGTTVGDGSLSLHN